MLLFAQPCEKSKTREAVSFEIFIFPIVQMTKITPKITRNIEKIILIAFSFFIVKYNAVGKIK